MSGHDQVSSPFGRASEFVARLGSSDRAQRAVTASPAAREVARRFIAAENTGEAVETVRQNHSKGLRSTLEPLLAPARGVDDVRAAVGAHRELVQEVSRAGLASVAEVTVKPSTIGLGLSDARLAQAALGEICLAARNAGSLVSLDLEEPSTTDETYALFSLCHQDFPQLGVTVQSRQRRSLVDSRWLASMPARVRLCKGGYSQPWATGHITGQDVDQSFIACLEVLMAGRGHPMVATHDPQLVEATIQIAGQHQRAGDSYEFQMYHGVRPWEHRRLVDTGHQVRVHLPVGSDWYAYLLRRVTERPANVMPLLRALVTRR
ncbi:proline dehydrogenase family protein [Luteococcus sediminum]